MKEISFNKKNENKAVEVINAAGKKTGLKKIDEWLANPQTDHKRDWIFRVEIEPFELALNSEKRKIETIDFFVNADARLHFLLDNALKNDNNFELQWIEEHSEKYIGFSKNNLNYLVVDSNKLDYGDNKEENTKIRQNSDLIGELKVDWKNINLLEYGFAFDLTSPQTISVNGRTFTYDKLFLNMDYPKEEYEWLKKRLMEWKENQKLPVIKDAILSTKSWLSVKDSNNLYITDTVGKRGIESLHNEWLGETVFENQNNGWSKLPYSKKEKFLKRSLKESAEDMKNEIEQVIKDFENDNNNDKKPEPEQKNPIKNNSASKFPWKIVGWITFAVLILVVVIIVIAWLKKRK
ncbi:MAG: hypothetical protein MRERC_3c074 [Mycoplasmataceae bacterium RC_NB112A]|nr:MAG: hypothetical protein MRERC_3c074 [Mycoplasmataceae bacterium RC_NB112A]